MNSDGSGLARCAAYACCFAAEPSKTVFSSGEMDFPPINIAFSTGVVAFSDNATAEVEVGLSSH